MHAYRIARRTVPPNVAELHPAAHHQTMAFDEGLAQRVRDHLGATAGTTEKKMFGGLAFLLDGNMAAGISGDELMVRLSPQDGDAALEEPHTRPFDMTGRPMRGWILVAGDGLDDDKQLAAWVDRGVAHAASLPAKR